MKIRSCRKADLAAVHALEVAVFGDHVYPDFFFRQALDLWPDSLLVAETTDGTLSGYVLGAPDQQPGVAWILSLAVSPQARGQGLGKRLTEQLLANFRRLGYQRVKLTVHPDNGAIGLYERLGFKTLGSESDYFGADEPRHLMALTC
ncbi:N-acetyltransferase [Gallaecimonas sp. GXIMD4217]|uniref:GNAT family N-acetyltransferase n=1 Tax=Gallaecimonas sp. GXIMD4217 TaxID=3131927 RepID=UPI00311AD204